MTNRTAWPTVATSDVWPALSFNTYCRDNDLAYWVFTQAGDVAYATSSAALARAAVGAVGSIRTSNGSIPGWTTKQSVAGMFHTWGEVDFAPGQTMSGIWADITGATLTLTLGVACSIMVIASVTGYNQHSGGGDKPPFYIRASVDGNVDGHPEYLENLAEVTPRNENLPYLFLKSGIAAGSRIVKLQSKATTDYNIITSGRLQAWAMVD